MSLKLECKEQRVLILRSKGYPAYPAIRGKKRKIILVLAIKIVTNLGEMPFCDALVISNNNFVRRQGRVDARHSVLHHLGRQPQDPAQAAQGGQEVGRQAALARRLPAALPPRAALAPARPPAPARARHHAGALRRPVALHGRTRCC